MSLLDLFRVLRADTAKQNYTVMPRLFYFPSLRTCRHCGRFFIFSAREQRYWYEVLKFYVDSTAVECANCRKQKREAQADLERYTEGLKDKALEDSQLMDLAAIGVHLFATGTLKRDQSVREILNRIRDKQKWQSKIESCRSRLGGNGISS